MGQQTGALAPECSGAVGFRGVGPEAGATSARGGLPRAPHRRSSAHMASPAKPRLHSRHRPQLLSVAALLVALVVACSVSLASAAAAAASAGSGSGSGGSSGDASAGSDGVYRTSAPVRKPRPEAAYDPFAQGTTMEDIMFRGEGVPGEVQSQVRPRLHAGSHASAPSCELTPPLRRCAMASARWTSRSIGRQSWSQACTRPRSSHHCGTTASDR